MSTAFLEPPVGLTTEARQSLLTGAARRPALQATEHTFVTHDGVELFYRAWLPATPANKAVLLFHRGHEHSGRWQDLVEKLDLADAAIFAWDARGHGRSPGRRGYADSLSVFVKDADAFARHLAAEHGIPVENMAVIAHSVGAVIAAAWVHDFAPRIRAMVLAAPAFRVKLYVPLALQSLRFAQLLGRFNTVKSYVKPTMITHDAAQADAYSADPLISREIATNILLDLHDTSTRLIKDAGAITTPTLLLSAGSDCVVHNRAQEEFFNRLSSPWKERQLYPGFYHALLHETDRHLPISRAREFITRAFEHDLPRLPLTGADRQGYTWTEYQQLRRGRPIWCAKRWSFAAQRLGLRTFGRLSQGIRLGWRSGFDSGQSLDGVYRNQPAGFTPLGKLIDYFYLNSIGWRGIRQRKVHLQQTLRRAINALVKEGESVRIVDIAAGPGRYLLDTFTHLPPVHDVRALCRDRSANALDQGRRLASEMSLSEKVTYATGDAFDPASLASIQPRPNVAVVSGLYELFPDNAMIRRSLAGLAAALPVGGYLVYTNQPWHPQVEMIARCLINRDHEPWVMRRRTQAEMDQLVRDAGFEKLDMDIDRWGIFTVSLARKP
jgi:alpha-beta hydrolase superfamily lysophospholipase